MSTEEQVQDQPVPPTKEEILNFLQEQIEVKSKQVELQELNTALAVGKAEELKALAFIAQITQKGGAQPQGTPHTITQEDLDANPELSDNGIKVGDEVIIPDDPSSNKDEKKRVLKK
jgi:hypothetical protein